MGRSHVCLQANYGKSSKEAVAAVKALYRDLSLEQAFFDYEQASHEHLSATIAEQTLLPKQVRIGLMRVSLIRPDYVVGKPPSILRQRTMACCRSAQTYAG